jgi:hypothetical protein
MNPPYQLLGNLADKFLLPGGAIHEWDHIGSDLNQIFKLVVFVQLPTIFGDFAAIRAT